MSKIVQDLMNAAESDTDLLTKNQELGDNLARSREVVFRMQAPSVEKAEMVAEFLNDFRYGDATAAFGENEKVVTVRIVMPITQHLICAVSGFFTCLSAIYELEYDGWESAIQRDI